MALADSTTAAELLNRSMSGDRVALQLLLRRHAGELARHIRGKLPTSIQSVVDVDDILQLALLDAFRKIEGFKPTSPNAFPAWLRGIADLHLKETNRMLHRVKRGGNHQRNPELLVELLSMGSRTPSKSAARHEAVGAIRDAVNDLPDDYRQAMQLRALEGKSLEDVAAVMQRTPRAVQGLLDRARKKMRDALGSLSLYQ